jgi:hypothetical protein
MWAPCSHTKRLTSNVYRRCSLAALDTSEIHHHVAVTNLGSRMQKAMNLDGLKVYDVSEPILMVSRQYMRYCDPVYRIFLHDKSKDDALIQLF